MQEQHARYKKKGQPKSIIGINPETKKKILSSIRNDVDFLKGQSLMDYSLLICIERKASDCEANFGRRFSINPETKLRPS